MSELKMISPLLDGLAVGGAISSHNGVSCYPVLDESTGNKYILKVISIPASRAQLDAFLLSGAYSDEAAALSYFKEQADEVLSEAKVLNELAQLEGYIAYEKVQLAPIEDDIGLQIYLLGSYKHTLESTMKKQPMTYLSAINLGLDLCAALTVCRRSGYLFVDLKPSNIFVAEDNTYRIGDLGLIRLDALSYASLPDRYRSAYTAPEIADAFSSLNTTIDVYAIGTILYQIYNNGELPQQILDSTGEPLAAPANADYEMSEIILKACAQRPEDRWEDPSQMGQALVSYMQRNGANDEPIIPPAVPDAGEVIDNSENNEAIVEIPEQLEPIDSESNEDAVVKTVDDTLSLDEETETAQQDEEESASVIDPQDADLGILSTLLQPSDDETAPENNETDVDNSEVSPEIEEILNQADEIINHPVPETVITAEPIEVPIPEPVDASDIDDTPADLEETDDTTATETDSNAADATVDTDAEDVQASTEAIAEEIDEDVEYEEDEDTEKPKKKKGGWLIAALIVLLLAGLVLVGAYFYKNYYLLPVESFNVVGKENYVTVTVETNVDEELLTVVCKGQHGDVLTAPLKNGTATFEDLNEDTAYVITLEVSGFHALSGDVSKAYSTPKITEITSFEVFTGSTSGSVDVVFTITGKDTDTWKLIYAAEGETENTAELAGKNETISGLTVGKEYSFTLEPSTELYLKGSNTTSLVVKEPTYAEQIMVDSFESGKMAVSWISTSEFDGKWTVTCTNESGSYNEEKEVTEQTAVFEGIDPTISYTVAVKAEGMKDGKSAPIAIGENALSKMDLTISDTHAILNWASTTDMGPWTVSYTIDGTPNGEAVETKEPNFTIDGLVPGATYCVTIKDKNGTVPTGGTKYFKAKSAEPFTCTYDGKTVTAEDMQANMCATDNVRGRWTSKIFSDTFKSGKKAGILIEKTAEHGYSQIEYVRVFAIYDKDGNFVTSSSTTNEWYMMWPNGNACELDIPAMPTTAGEYTLRVFFNGQLVATTQFKITE